MKESQIRFFMSQLSDEQLLAKLKEAQEDLALARVNDPGSDWQHTCEAATFSFGNEKIRREMLREFA